MTTASSRQFAVVTGASSGIGLELARQFAEHGFDLLIVAEDDDLRAAARALTATGAQVADVRADLTTYEGVESVYRRIFETGRPVDALALNAGVGIGGRFVEIDLQDQLRVVDLNVRSTVHLARRVLPDMVARRSGRVLFTSSIASMQPGTYQAVYNATKSFDQSLAEALREELRDTGVTVTALMPGPTDTGFFERADMADTPVGSGQKDDPAQVAKQGFEALMSGKEKVVAGSVKTRLLGKMSKVTPDSVKAKLHARMAEPGGGD